MLEITMKFKGEPGSGKTQSINNIASTMKNCPFEFRLECWTKQPAAPFWERELALTNEGGQQIENWTVVRQEEEPV